VPGQELREVVMHIEIIDASAMAVITICPPGLRIQEIKDGGLIVSLRAHDDAEKKLLRFLLVEFLDHARKRYLPDFTIGPVCSELNEGKWGFNWVAYQITAPKRDVGYCYVVAGEIAVIIGAVYAKYLKPLAETI
jgi:hypothetical protein